MKGIFKKIAFGDNSMRFSVVRKVFYTFLHHKKSIIVSITLFCIAGKVFAGESVYIPISCRIPAIPGINAPIISDEKNMRGEDIVAQNQEEPKEPLPEIKEKIIPDELPALKKDNAEHIFFLSQDNTATGLVQTVYSR